MKFDFDSGRVNGAGDIFFRTPPLVPSNRGRKGRVIATRTTNAPKSRFFRPGSLVHLVGCSVGRPALRFINHALGKLCLADKRRQAKYVEPDWHATLRIADIGTF
jgi:hypothetical protein